MSLMQKKSQLIQSGPNLYGIAKNLKRFVLSIIGTKNEASEMSTSLKER